MAPMTPAPPSEDRPPARPARVHPAMVALALATAVVVVVVIGWSLGRSDGAGPAPTQVDPRTQDQPTAPPQGAATVGEPLPDLAFAGLGGAPAGTLGQYVGRPMVINFFAYWCVPCREEMPDLQAVHERAGSEVTVLGLHYVEPEERGVQLVEETGVSFPVGADPTGEIFEALGGLGMPTTVFVRADGTIATVHTGRISAAEIDRILADDVRS